MEVHVGRIAIENDIIVIVNKRYTFDVVGKKIKIFNVLDNGNVQIESSELNIPYPSGETWMYSPYEYNVIENYLYDKEVI